jgi:hypothetical protein
MDQKIEYGYSREFFMNFNHPFEVWTLDTGLQLVSMGKSRLVGNEGQSGKQGQG